VVGEPSSDGDRRSRRRLGSQRRASWPVRASICVQAMSSQASATTAHQIWFCVKSCRQVRESGVLGVAEAVLAAGPAAVPQFEIGELAAGGVGGEGGDAVPVDAGQAQLRAGMWAFLAHDDPHPLRQERRLSTSVTSATQAPSRSCPSAS
jgi:hypothetical protein